MEQASSESWLKGGLIAVICLAIACGAIYLACGRGSDKPSPPAGSFYYKGVMNADLESQAHDPRKHRGAAKRESTKSAPPKPAPAKGASS